MLSVDNFFFMGGYAFYVWSAYGVATVGLAGITLACWRGLSAKRRQMAVLDETE